MSREEFSHDAALEAVVQKIMRIIQLKEDQSKITDSRVSALYRLSLISFSILVISISSLVILLAAQMPNVSKAIMTMNTHFAAITENMERMRQDMGEMEAYINSLPDIVTHMDHMHSNIVSMDDHINTMAIKMDSIEGNLAQVVNRVGNMRESIQWVDSSVYFMRSDLQRMSSPMRMFNFFNPFW